MITSEHINELAEALAAAQAEMQPVAKTKKMNLPNRPTYFYADVADILSAVLPVLAKHKLSVVQATGIDEGVMLIETRLLHASGQWLSSTYPVCSVDGNHQRMGAALTYSRRFALSSLIGVAAEEDTDGDGAEDVKAPAKKANGPSRQTTTGPTLEQQARKNFTAYLDMVEEAFKKCTTQDDLDERSAYYGPSEVRMAIDPTEWEDLVARYNWHADRIEAGKR